ncbi:MAG TPA: nuclear transport factor 2 family protein [Polyangiaceae bacterium]|jgi:uncharacterized protein (TIGR02246 family)|nr:nuclear transport factor 2 family protein [Polyangiaceae bacterium]
MTEQNPPQRPNLTADEPAVKEASDAVIQFVAELQAGWDQRDAELTDRRLAANVAWGSPFGATVEGYERLHVIHAELKKQGKGGTSSRFEIERVLVPGPGIAIAQVRRHPLGPDGRPLEPSSDTSGAFSESALYVLIRRDRQWWVAAGHNTPIRVGGEV